MRRLQAPNKHGLWFYFQRLSVRFLCNTPCTQTNQPVGFEPVEKVPSRHGKNEVRTREKRGVFIPTPSQVSYLTGLL